MSIPKQFGTEYSSIFKDESVVEAYRYRPPYPPGVFALLLKLLESADRPWRVLDAGCGTGFVARELLPSVDEVDAVDVSKAMIENGKMLPGGDDPNLRWIHGPVEEATLRPPYSLVVAAASLHWMEWNKALPRFAQILDVGGYLAVVEIKTAPVVWDADAKKVFGNYSMNRDFAPYSMVTVAAELTKRKLFEQVGMEETESVAFRQSIDEWVESVHARNGFSRDRMNKADAATCDEQLREIASKHNPDGMIERSIRGCVIWGKPLMTAM